MSLQVSISATTFLSADIYDAQGYKISLKEMAGSLCAVCRWLAEVCFPLLVWAFCLRLRQKMSLLHLNSPSHLILCPKATKLFHFFILKFPCTLQLSKVVLLSKMASSSFWPNTVPLSKQHSICIVMGRKKKCMFTLPSKHWPKGKVHSWIAFNTLDRGGQGQTFWS